MRNDTEIPLWVKVTAVTLAALVAAAVIGGMLLY